MSILNFFKKQDTEPKNNFSNLKEENDYLKKSLAFKSDFIIKNNHQLRTGLSANKWIIKMLIDGDLGELTHEQKSFLEKSYESNERLIKLTTEMLNMNKSSEIGTGSESTENIDLVDMVEDVIFDFKGESFNKNIEVIFLKPEAKIPLIRSNFENTRIIFQNLIENALKYSLENSKIFISLRQEKEGVVFSIKDNGIGIKKEDQSNIFKKFFRTENAMAVDPNGTGLGLFMIKNMIEKNKGRIWFESTENKGTTFYVSFPI